MILRLLLSAALLAKVGRTGTKWYDGNGRYDFDLYDMARY